MRRFHHGWILGGLWYNPEKQFIAILASDSKAKPIQILPKFMKYEKVKTNSTFEFISNLSSEREFIALKNLKTEFNYKNIVPLKICWQNVS